MRLKLKEQENSSQSYTVKTRIRHIKWSLILHFDCILTEEATRGVLLEKVFVESSQNSQESICARVPF